MKNKKIKKNWKYVVKCEWTGSYNDCTKADALEMIKDSIAEEFNFTPDDDEIFIEEDTND